MTAPRPSKSAVASGSTNSANAIAKGRPALTTVCITRAAQDGYLRSELSCSTRQGYRTYGVECTQSGPQTVAPPSLVPPIPGTY